MHESFETVNSAGQWHRFDIIRGRLVFFKTSSEGGFTVWVPSMPGCISEGETMHQAAQNIREAMDFWISP